jgi:preprotein translocase subunit SecE
MADTDRATATPERGGGAGRSTKEPKRSAPARLSLFYRQVIAELRKVIWPTRKELITYTTVVVVFVLIIIAYVSVLDLGFGQVVLRIFG